MTAPDWIADALDGVPALLTIGEAADLLRVSRRTVTRAIAAGELTSTHVGSAVRVPRRAVADYLARRA